VGQRAKLSHPLVLAIATCLRLRLTTDSPVPDSGINGHRRRPPVHRGTRRNPSRPIHRRSALRASHRYPRRCSRRGPTVILRPPPLCSGRLCHQLPTVRQTHTAQPTPQPPLFLDSYHPLIWLPTDRQRRLRRWKAEPWPDPEVPDWQVLLNEVPTGHFNVLSQTPAGIVGETSNYSAGNAGTISDPVWGIWAVFQRR